MLPDILPYFKALADGTRLRLLHVLRHYELNVNELVLILEMGQSRISRHLKILSSADLLLSRRNGLWVFYSTPQLGKAKKFIDAMLPFCTNDPVFVRDLRMAESIMKERAHKTQQFFNSVAEDWDALSHEVLGNFDLASVTLEYMPECVTAADFGCGTGNVLAAMLKKAKIVIGVDGSPRMLELAKRRLNEHSERISLRIGDLAHLPLRNNEADFGCLNMVLHHLPAPGEALLEIKRVLQPDAKLLLIDFDQHDVEEMRQKYNDHWLGFESKQLHNYLEKAGFRIVRSGLAPVERGLSLHIILAECASA